eukprot:scaffold59621_cov22-Tisochrysis_lutea.AAC.1
MWVCVDVWVIAPVLEPNHDAARLFIPLLHLFSSISIHVQYSVCTRAYKAPELLLKYTYYNYAIDMWGVGMHLGSFVFRKKQIFGCEWRRPASRRSMLFASCLCCWPVAGLSVALYTSQRLAA